MIRSNYNWVAYLIQFFELSDPNKQILNLADFFEWMKLSNVLGSNFSDGLMWQIAEQERFYQKIYGRGFHIDLKKISIHSGRLPAIKAGLEAGCINYALVKVMPRINSNIDEVVNNDFALLMLLRKIRKNNFRIMVENGELPSSKLVDFIKQSHSTNYPWWFRADAFKDNWAKEAARVRGMSKNHKMQVGDVEIIFTSSLPEIPRDQAIVNEKGEVIKLADYSYISAITNEVRVLSREERILLASQLHFKDGTRLARKTWEWERDLVDSKDGVLIATAHSSNAGFHLCSRAANYADSEGRFRLAV